MIRFLLCDLCTLSSQSCFDFVSLANLAYPISAQILKLLNDCEWFLTTLFTRRRLVCWYGFYNFTYKRRFKYFFSLQAVLSEAYLLQIAPLNRHLKMWVCIACISGLISNIVSPFSSIIILLCSQYSRANTALARSCVYLSTHQTFRDKHSNNFVLLRLAWMPRKVKRVNNLKLHF